MFMMLLKLKELKPTNADLAGRSTASVLYESTFGNRYRQEYELILQSKKESQLPPINHQSFVLYNRCQRCLFGGTE